MAGRLLPPEPDDSELARWRDDGFVAEPSHSNIITYGSPNDAYRLVVELDDPVDGYLIRLYRSQDVEDNDPIGQTVVDDRELAGQVAAQMAAAAADLAAVTDRPHLGPKKVHREDLEAEALDSPDDWDDDDWQDAIEDAFEKAEIMREKGTITEKTIDGRDYYYLQWREGDKVKSQYVAPVTPKD